MLKIAAFTPQKFSGSMRINNRSFSTLVQIPAQKEKLINNYLAAGYTSSWIDARIKGMVARDELLKFWSSHGIKTNYEFSDLTAVISKETFGMRPSEYKKFKGLKDQSLRDHMSEIELKFVEFGEIAALEYGKSRSTFGYQENKLVCLTAGVIAKQSLEQYEYNTNTKVATKVNFLGKKLLDFKTVTKH